MALCKRLPVGGNVEAAEFAARAESLLFVSVDPVVLRDVSDSLESPLSARTEKLLPRYISDDNFERYKLMSMELSNFLTQFSSIVGHDEVAEGDEEEIECAISALIAKRVELILEPEVPLFIVAVLSRVIDFTGNEMDAVIALLDELEDAFDGRVSDQIADVKAYVAQLRMCRDVYENVTDYECRIFVNDSDETGEMMYVFFDKDVQGHLLAHIEAIEGCIDDIVFEEDAQKGILISEAKDKLRLIFEQARNGLERSILDECNPSVWVSNILNWWERYGERVDNFCQRTGEESDSDEDAGIIELLREFVMGVDQSSFIVAKAGAYIRTEPGIGALAANMGLSRLVMPSLRVDNPFRNHDNSPTAEDLEGKYAAIEGCFLQKTHVLLQEYRLGVSLENVNTFKAFIASDEDALDVFEVGYRSSIYLVGLFHLLLHNRDLGLTNVGVAVNGDVFGFDTKMIGHIGTVGSGYSPKDTDVFTTYLSVLGFLPETTLQPESDVVEDVRLWMNPAVVLTAGNWSRYFTSGSIQEVSDRFELLQSCLTEEASFDVLSLIISPNIVGYMNLMLPYLTFPKERNALEGVFKRFNDPVSSHLILMAQEASKRHGDNEDVYTKEVTSVASEACRLLFGDDTDTKPAGYFSSILTALISIGRHQAYARMVPELMGPYEVLESNLYALAETGVCSDLKIFDSPDMRARSGSGARSSTPKSLLARVEGFVQDGDTSSGDS